MTRLFDAPRAARVRGDDEAGARRRWWGILGEGYSVPVCEIDLRLGGKWRFVEPHAQGRVAAFYGEYREIAAPGRVVFTEIFEPFPDVESVVTPMLTEEGGKTRLTVTALYPSREVRDMVLGTGMETRRRHQLRPPRRSRTRPSALDSGRSPFIARPCGL